MTTRRGVLQTGRLALAFCCASVFMQPPVHATGEDAGSSYQYSDDWDLVSAPPPPGPYETVNLDPRVPGQDVARPVPQDLMMDDTAARLPGELEQVPPPGAGRQVESGMPREMSRQRTYTAPRPPGAYGQQGRSGPARQTYREPGNRGYGGYQQYRGYPAYPGYGQGQGYGYAYPYSRQYSPPRQQDIPLPPYAIVPGR